MRHRIYKSMYAVSCKEIGLIGGTLSYTRREAIMHFQGGGFIAKEWEDSKREGLSHRKGHREGDH